MQTNEVVSLLCLLRRTGGQPPLRNGQHFLLIPTKKVNTTITARVKGKLRAALLTAL